MTKAMEEKIKILVIPSLNSEWEALKLGEKLDTKGYEIKVAEGAFGEIVGLETISKCDYLSFKPHLIVAIGVGCITVGTFGNAMRIMINPDFHYSDFLNDWISEREDRIERGAYDEKQLAQVIQDCSDADYDSGVAKSLESEENSVRGKEPMLGIFTYESENMRDYQARYGDYESHLDLNLNESDSLDILVARIERFLKDSACK